MMSSSKPDNELSRIVKGLPSADWKQREKIEGAFNAYITENAIPLPVTEMLVTGLEMIRDYKHETKRKTPEEYAEVIRTLLDFGYTKYASTLFSSCYQTIQQLPEYIMTCILPAVKDAEFWIKESQIDKKEFMEKIVSEPGEYYNSICFDWACKVVPIASMQKLAGFPLQGDSRFGYLDDPEELLSKIVGRDRNGVICMDLLSIAEKSRETLERLINTVSGLPEKWEVWAHAIAEYLLCSNASGEDSMLLDSLITYFEKPRADNAKFCAIFPAHLLTTIPIMAETLKSLDSDRVNAIIRRLVKVTLHGTQVAGGSSVWVAGPVGAVTDALVTGESALTLHGARKMVQGLIAMETNTDPVEVFRAVAMNLGLGQLEKLGDVADYDPGQHQDIQGGILPGERVKVVKAGWMYEGSVVSRAEVVRDTGDQPCIDQQ